VDWCLSFLQVDGIHSSRLPHLCVVVHIKAKSATLDLEEVVLSNSMMEKADEFSIRLLSWLLAGFVVNVVVVVAYYVKVRSNADADEMMMGLDDFVDRISVSVDYNSLL
jgi:hypothetical protein